MHEHEPVPQPMSLSPTVAEYCKQGGDHVWHFVDIAGLRLNLCLLIIQRSDKDTVACMALIALLQKMKGVLHKPGTVIAV